MNWAIAAVGAVLIGQLIFRFWLSKTARFWHLASRNPDLAIEIFNNEDNCLVDIEPALRSKKNFIGPFRLMDSAGRRHRIYLPSSHIANF